MSSLQEHLDIKLFLRTTAAKAHARRAARSGYITLEGFWEDPPGYVEKIVWPNYVKEHAFLFEGADVERRVNEEVAREKGIEYMKGVDAGDEDMGKVLEWAVQLLMKKVPEIAEGGERS
jgi:nicotinamide/nicotinate riboside kinase